MKFGQLIEYNIRNIFLEKSYTNCDQEAIPRPEFHTVCFYCMLSWGLSKNIETKMRITSQLTFTCSKPATETLEKCVKYV